MAEIEYKIFFNNNSATREQLDMVEEITVEQDIDMAWHATLNIPICTDDKGNWTGVDDAFMAPFGRVRVEIKVAGGDFVPLIDGPIVGSDNTMSSEPGQSAIVLQVQDDSVYLNRKEAINKFDDMLDSDVASQLFGEVEQIATTDVET